ncbi:MAG: RdgB/HAM1 family non-canonical purine NTP pyrophosphatase, partial [Gammaproteobacteria bacterium]
MELVRDHALVLASGNAGKLRELRELLQPIGFLLRPQSDWDTPEAVEDGLTFVENALIKARNACAHAGHPAIADDSGLVVPALGGAPGIRSARYGGEPRSDAANNEKLLRAMRDLRGDDRAAYFYCAMVLARSPDDPAPLVATASWWGEILPEPRGEGGFGYDPLFLLPEQGCSSAELPPQTKNRLSHRGQAVRAL